MYKFHEFYQELSEQEKLEMIGDASSAFAKFLESLRVDWQNDPETKDTPKRVAEMYVRDLLAGRFSSPPKCREVTVEHASQLTLKVFGPITVKSLCIHHCMPFVGSVIVGINCNSSAGIGLGLSKYAELCHWYARRGQIQERLGGEILNALLPLHKGLEVAVFIKAQHTCFSSRTDGECASDLYTVHTTKKFENYNMFVTSCMQMS